jgi:signal transduction histidine kinase
MPRERSKRTAGIALLVGLAIVLRNLLLGLLYRDSRHGLETELARRLENVAAVLGSTLDPGLVQRAAIENDLLRVHGAPAESLYFAPAYDSLRALLRDIADGSDLANVRVFAPGTAFLDLAAGSLLETHEASIRRACSALSGTTAHSDLPVGDGIIRLRARARQRWSASGAVAVEADALSSALRNAVRDDRERRTVSARARGAGSDLRACRASQRAEAAVSARALAAMGRMAAGIAHEIRTRWGSSGHRGRSGSP